MKKLLKGRWLRRICFVFLIFMLASQLLAKYYLGLGDIPVYITDKEYEYIYAPNQDVWRFHNHICTNEKSMRSKPLSKKDRVRILKFGDSVINGGAHVDQDRLSSTILENNLSKIFNKEVRVLNISAQSWGPDNAFAYLKKHGSFGSDFFVLVFSSHDLHDNMHFRPVVGQHKAWPDSRPWCALTDGFNRYLVPKVKRMFGGSDEEYDYLYDFDDSKINPGWQQFFDYAHANGTHLLVYVHPTLTEVRQKNYDRYGQQLIQMLEANKVEVIQGISHIKDPGSYRDNIHLNAKGHEKLARVLLPRLEEYVKEKLEKPG